MSKIGQKKESMKQQDLKKIEEMREAKRRKKQLKEQQERQKKLRQQRAIIDKQVQLIYNSGLADAYKYFLQEAFREDVKFSIYQYAAQKILKFQKLRKQKEKRLSSLQK